MPTIIDVKAFGAKGDVESVSDGKIEAGSLNTLILITAKFIPDDKLKTIRIEKAGKDGSPLYTIIDSVHDGLDKVTLHEAASKSVSSASVTWGTDDTIAIQKAINSGKPGDTISFPAGTYYAHNLSLRSGISFLSTDGASLTQLIGLVKGVNSYFFIDRRGETICDVTFTGLKFDGNQDDGPTISRSIMIALGNANNHSHFKFLECELKSFAYGILVRGYDHSFFEISNCKFTNIGGFSIGFQNTSTSNIKIIDCEFKDCEAGIQIFPDPNLGIWNVCDHVLIERCHFSGKMHNYPIHFGGGPSNKYDFRFAATYVTVKDCIVRGPEKWFLYHNGSADQIALYGVKYFTVTGNISNGGGDGGIVIQDCQYGMVSRNKCERNFGPGIIISGAFININGNVCINNCRRISEKEGTTGERTISIAPAGIVILGNDILVNNNLCFDDMSLSINPTQSYGLAVAKLIEGVAIGSKVIVGHNFFIDNVPSPSPKDVFYEDGSTHEEFSAYPTYVAAGHFIMESPISTPTSEALPAAGYRIKKDGGKVPSYINVAGNDLMGAIIFDVPKDSLGLESGKLLKITFTTSHSIKAISLKPRSHDTDLLNATVSFDGMPPPYWFFLIEIAGKAIAGKTYIWDYQVD